MVNNKENLLTSEPAMEGILKHMTRTTRNIKSATIFTKKDINILIVQTIRKKRMMTKTIPIPVNKVKPIIKPVQRYKKGQEYLHHPTR